MMKQNIIASSATLLEAINQLNELSGSAMTLFVTDNSGKMIGTLTDGDIRRALIRGVGLHDEASEAVNTSFHSVTGPLSSDTVAILKNFRMKGIRVVPRLDSSGNIIEIIDLKKTPARLPVRALLMAGGLGERLRPMTLTTPKPLLKIEDKCIIDYNIEALAAAGINDITVATRYLAESIEEHFKTPVAGVSVKCVRESSPLGTIGAASLLPEQSPDGATLVMNSDIITSISFEEMFLKHKSRNADITIAVVPYQVAVPFAILTLDGEKVTGLEEKPSYSYYANAGIYLIKNSILASVRPDTRTDATDLIEQTIAKGGNVTYYPIEGTWIDVGSPTDFNLAQEIMRHHRALPLL